MDDIKINRTNTNYSATSRWGNKFKEDVLPKKYECALCHKKYATPFERMQCEFACTKKQDLYEKSVKMIQEKRNREIERQRLAKEDTDKIQKEYQELINHVNKHWTEFNESVYLDGKCYGHNESANLYSNFYKQFFEF